MVAGLDLGLRCLMLLSTIFQLYRSWSVSLVEDTEYTKKTTSLLKVNDNLYHFKLYQVVTPHHKQDLNLQFKR